MPKTKKRPTTPKKSEEKKGSTSKLILWGGAAVLAYYILSKLRLANSIVVVLRNIKFGGSLLNPIITVDLGLSNPTKHTAIVNVFSGTLKYNGQDVAIVSMSDKTYIQPETETLVEAQIQPIFTGVANTILTMIQNTTTGQLTMDGYINVDGVNYPVEVKNQI